jgi:hypothetical protein
MLVLGGWLVLLASVSAAAGPALYVNGRHIVTQPGVVEQQGVSYGPLRAVVEAVGGQVEWHAAGHFATICCGRFCLKINESEGIVVDGHLLLPIRKLAESLGGTVRYTDGDAPRIDLAMPSAG